MPMQWQLRTLLTEKVTIEHYLWMDEYTEFPQYQAPSSLDARVIARPRMLRVATGEQVISSTTVIVDGDPKIGLMDRITLPDGMQPNILQVHKAQDDHGVVHHTRIWCT
jgi:hypothetical protein